MSKIWLTSDLHFLHNREFIFGPRGFKNIEEMNSEIVRRHNELVAPDDDVYILGDLSLGGGGDEVLVQAKRLIEGLNGRIHIILGNHDTNSRINLYLQLDQVVEVTYATMIKYKKAATALKPPRNVAILKGFVE